MKTHDINEEVKKRLTPFLTTDWNILPSEDLESQRNQFNEEEKEKEIKITAVNNILWFAQGFHNSTFFLKDYSLDSKISRTCNLPTEYLGALVIHQNNRCILSASWHGYEFIIMDNIKTCFEAFPISQDEISFCLDIVQVLSK